MYWKSVGKTLFANSSNTKFEYFSLKDRICKKDICALGHLKYRRTFSNGLPAKGLSCLNSMNGHWISYYIEAFSTIKLLLRHGHKESVVMTSTKHFDPDFYKFYGITMEPSGNIWMVSSHANDDCSTLMTISHKTGRMTT